MCWDNRRLKCPSDYFKKSFKRESDAISRVVTMLGIIALGLLFNYREFMFV